MFQNYQSIFELKSIPHKQVIEYETIFRTKTTWDRSYVYPLKVAHYVSVVPYYYKAVICTIYEMKLWEVRDAA